MAWRGIHHDFLVRTRQRSSGLVRLAALLIVLPCVLFGQVRYETSDRVYEAKGAHTPASYPDRIAWSFEDPAVRLSSTGDIIYGRLLAPSNSWRGWLMNASAGIARNKSRYTRFNDSAPFGSHVAFIQGKSWISYQRRIEPGSWRLRFFAAQRKRPTKTDNQTLCVSMDGRQILQVRPRGAHYEEYVTSTFTLTGLAKPVFRFEGAGLVTGDHTAFIDGLRLERVREWQDPSTWQEGQVPNASHHVVIPKKGVVCLNGLGCVAKGVRVEGELHASQVSASLRSEFVFVGGQKASFCVGSEDTPYLGSFKLTLVGKDKNANHYGAGNKFLVAADGGEINLIGQEKVSWAKLGSTALPGLGQVTLSSPVDWRPGDRIVIAPSNHQRSTDVGVPNYVDESEVKTVLSVSPNGMTVFLDTAKSGLIQFRHNGAAPQGYTSPPRPGFPNGQSWFLDQRSEVGLLTRNIVIEGDRSSNSTRFGGHIMVRHGHHGAKHHASAKLSYVELRRMGQEQILGRYPIHWHLMADQAKGQFIKNCSIHQSFNRGIVIHGTDHLLVERNVLFNTVGHAVFLEDGAEENNRIIENLVINTIKPHPGKEMLPSDNELEQLQNRTPAAFWITNPNNEIVGNVAAGTEGTGFWFIFPENVLGQSASHRHLSMRKPIENDLGVFDGNVAHSCGSGFDINDSINPQNDRIIKNVPWRPRSGQATIENLTIYACDMGLYAGVSEESITFRRICLSDNNENIRIAAYHTVRESLIVAGTGRVNFGGGGEFGYVVYDGAATIEHCHFVDFHLSNRAMIRSAGAAVMHPNHTFENVTYNHSGLPVVIYEDYAASLTATGLPIGVYPHYCSDDAHRADSKRWGIAVRDIDGSIWGVPGSTLIGNHPLMYDASADITPLGLPANNNVVLSSHRFGHLRILHDGLGVGAIPGFFIRRQATGFDPGTALSYQFCFQNTAHRQLPVFVDSNALYQVAWMDTNNVTAIRLIFDDVEPGDSVRIDLAGLSSLGAPTAVTNSAPATSLAALWSANATGHFFSGSSLYFHLIATGNRHEIDIVW